MELDSNILIRKRAEGKALLQDREDWGKPQQAG
jgi:hypothetical protein